DSDASPLGMLAATPSGPEPQRELEPPPDEAISEVEALTARAHGIYAKLPERRFGYWANGAIWGILTYAFLHAGLAHFLGNAWFLWLSGATIEDRWGRG